MRTTQPNREDLLKPYALNYGLSSAIRILATIDSFRQRHDKWPSKVAMDSGMFEALQRDIFTPLGWSLMAGKLELSPDAKGTVIAFGDDGSKFDYEDVTNRLPPNENRADVWLWGMPLAD